MYKLNGTIQTLEGESLKNPEFERGEVRYRRHTKKALIEVLYYITTIEGQRLTFSDTFEFDCDGDWSKADAEAAMLSLFTNYTYIS